MLSELTWLCGHTACNEDAACSRASSLLSLCGNEFFCGSSRLSARLAYNEAIMTTSVWTGSSTRVTAWAGSVRFPKLQLEINDLVLTVTEEICRLHAGNNTRYVWDAALYLQLQLA